MSFTRADLKAFYRSGFLIGFGFERGSEPTVEEIDEYFESAYTRFRESQKVKSGSNKLDAEGETDKWVAGVPRANPPLFPPTKKP